MAVERVELRTTTRWTANEESDPLTNGEWVTLTIGFGSESLMIRNSGDTILEYRDEAGEDIHEIMPDETWETSLETRNDFQLRANEDDHAYRAWSRTN